MLLSGSFYTTFLYPTPEHLPEQSHKRQKNQGSSSCSFRLFGTPKATFQICLSGIQETAERRQAFPVPAFLGTRWRQARKTTSLSPSSILCHVRGPQSDATHCFPSMLPPSQGPACRPCQRMRQDGRNHPLMSLPCFAPQGPGLSSPKLGSNTLSRYNF